MPTFPIANIFFDRASRQRKSIGDLEDLMQSIREVGLINPVVITREGRLIAGERRYTACRELGWTSIPVTIFEDMTPVQLEQVELDENIRRLDLPWQDRVMAVQRYHELMRMENPSSPIQATADRLGMSSTNTELFLGLASAIRAGDKSIAEAPKLSVARGIYERRQARRRDNELEQLDNLAKATAPSTTPSTPTIPDEPEDDFPIIQADFHLWQPTYSGPKFNLIHCDFPYGINAGNHDMGAGASFGGYVDEEETYWDLVYTLNAAMKNVVADSAHLIFWFSMKYYKNTYESLTDMGWTVNPYPLVWHRSDNSGILPDPKRGPRQIYETAFFCTRGDRFIVRAKSNLIASPNVKSIHMSEKPVNALTPFLQMVVDDTTRIFDPTAGSGNALRVALDLGASSALGLEIDPEFLSRARDNWSD